MRKSVNKNYTICIETTSNICGICIANDKNIIYEKNLDLGLNHSIVLFDNIVDALKSTKICFDSIKIIKVSCGPGSFTGIRIGIATAIGLSIPYDTPIEYVDTLDSFCRYVSDNESYIISMIDAKNDRVYMSMYKSEKKIIDDITVNVHDLSYLLNKHFSNSNTVFNFVGPGAINYKNVFKAELNIKHKILSKSYKYLSSNLCYTNGKESKNPIINYIVSSKAEREYNAKH